MRTRAAVQRDIGRPVVRKLDTYPFRSDVPNTADMKYCVSLVRSTCPVFRQITPSESCVRKLRLRSTTTWSPSLWASTKPPWITRWCLRRKTLLSRKFIIFPFGMTHGYHQQRTVRLLRLLDDTETKEIVSDYGSDGSSFSSTESIT